MIKHRTKNYSLGPKHDVGDILDFCGYKVFTTKLLKPNVLTSPFRQRWR